MSTQPKMHERHVRVCPVHGIEVRERGSALVCPRGDHAVSHFKVFDTAKRRTVFDAAVDGDERRGGVSAEGEGLRMKPGKPRTPTPSPPAPKAGPRPAVETLEKAKFRDAEGAWLWVRLLRTTTARRGDVYSIVWARYVRGAGKSAESTGKLDAGGVHLEPVRTAFAAVLAQAKADGWSETPVSYREIKLKPLPPPARSPRP